MRDVPGLAVRFEHHLLRGPVLEVVSQRADSLLLRAELRLDLLHRPPGPLGRRGPPGRVGSIRSGEQLGGKRPGGRFQNLHRGPGRRLGLIGAGEVCP